MWVFFFSDYILGTVLRIFSYIFTTTLHRDIIYISEVSLLRLKEFKKLSSAFPLFCPHMVKRAERERQALLSFLIRALMPSLGLPLYDLITSQRPHIQISPQGVLRFLRDTVKRRVFLRAGGSHVGETQSVRLHSE